LRETAIDAAALDPFFLVQRPVNPEAIQAGFLNHNEWEKPALPGARLIAKNFETGDKDPQYRHLESCDATSIRFRVKAM